jgi:EAL domain-containing protein (putative c-di-GMP-specific phosphodiesterase class I)
MRTQVMHEPAVATPWLESSSVDEAPGKTHLESFPFKIGRKETADLCIDSTRVSREHAVITRHGKKFHIHDLGSTNGTFVNGQRVQEAVLCDGDQLMIAEVEFTFYSGGPPVEREVATQVVSQAAAPTIDSVQQTLLAVRRVHEVVTRRGVRIVYQPIIELETGDHFGYEALATSGGGDVPQSRGEQWTGGIECRAAARLRRLCRRMAAEQSAGLPPGRLLVALAAAEADGLSAVHHLCQLRDQIGSSRPLVVEIPDGAVRDTTEFRELRSALRNAHVQVAYDGYASGKAQIVDLKDFAPDYLKLAPSVLRSIQRGNDRQRQVQLMVRASQDLGAGVIATGVDSEVELEVCHSLKCALVQGELFGSPQPASALAHVSRTARKTSERAQ